MFNTWLRLIATNIGITLITFVSGVIAARGLGPEGRGTFSSLQLLGTLVAGLAQCGLGYSFIYSFRASREFPAINIFRVSTIFIAAFAAAISILFLNFGYRLTPTLILEAVLLSVITATVLFVTAASQIAPDLAVYNKSRVLSVFAIAVSYALFWSLGALSVAIVAWVQIISLGGTLLFSYWAIEGLINKNEAFDRGVRKIDISEYISSGLKYQGTSLLSLLLLNIDKIYILFSGNLKNFGLYTVAYSASRLIGGLQESASTAIYSRYAGRGGEELNEATQFCFRISFLPLLICCGFISPLSPLLFKIIYGPAYASAGIAFALLCFECVISGSGWILAQSFNAAGKPGLILLRQVMAVVPVMGIIFFIPPDSALIGIPLALLVGSTIRLVVTIFLYKWSLGKKFETPFPKKSDYEFLRKIIFRSQLAQKL